MNIEVKKCKCGMHDYEDLGTKCKFCEGQHLVCTECGFVECFCIYTNKK